MKRLIPRVGLAAYAAALAVFCSSTDVAIAQDKKLVLRVADSFPVTHYTPPHVKYWMEQVKTLSGGSVDFEYYPSEQMGKAKDLLSNIQSGVIDIGYVAPSYVSDKMPLSGVVHLPGTFQKSCQGSFAYWKLARDEGLIARAELASNGVRLLFTAALQPYQVFSTTRPLDSAKAIEGMKLRSTGGVMDLTVRKVKAVPIQMASPEIHQSLSRGTLDGGVFPFTSVFSYGWGTLVKYATIGENFGSFLVTYMISERKWKELSPDVQKAMIEVGEATTRRHCIQLEQDELQDIEKLRKLGVTIAELPKEAKEAIAKSISSVAEDWAQSLDKRGKPGSEVLKAYIDAVNQSK